MTRAISAFCVLLFVTLSAHAEVSVRNQETAKLHDIFNEHWNRLLEENPVYASYLGDRRFNAELPDRSPESRQRSHEGDVRALQQLRAIDRELLSETDRLNYRLFEREYRDSIEAHHFDMHLIPISQRGGIQTFDETGNRIRMTERSDFEDWLVRLSKLDVYMDQTIARMRSGMERGVVPPKATMRRVPAQIEKQIVDEPTESLFYKPFTEMPASISDADKKRLQQRAQAIIASTVIPAYEELLTFFTREYYPACRESVGVSDLPNGKAFYEHRVRLYTTTDMTPDQVHQLGLEEVARNRREMLEVMDEVGFDGTLDEFFEYLRTDPKFYYETSEELFEGYLAVSKRIDPKLIHLFGKLPRMPYGLKKIPDAIAPDTTTAYYTRPAADGSRPGYYYVNLYKPETRPKWEMEVLSVHEAVPGHHLQIALQQELEEMPNFRRHGGFTAFTEGWGLYSERLGYDLGLYKDPYSRFGQLTYDMWRAVRLVVDTGMHYKGWTRERAIEYFMDNAPKTEHDITNEIDRYISNPGQALAYKLGQMKLIEMREYARDELGDEFDIKDYHDKVLSYGSVPLSVLEDVVKEWVAEQKAQS